MKKIMDELEALTQEIISKYRGYFSLLRNYQAGSHEKLMTQLDQIHECERKLKTVIQLISPLRSRTWRRRNDTSRRITLKLYAVPVREVVGQSNSIFVILMAM